LVSYLRTRDVLLSRIGASIKRAHWTLAVKDSLVVAARKDSRSLAFSFSLLDRS
jgi:hypothetical protein